MSEYKIGKIYKIIYIGNENININYIGSTLNTLRDRWYGHKGGFKEWLKNKKTKCSIYDYFEKYDIKKFKIFLINEYKVYDRKHLLMYEQLWINKIINNININNPFPILIKEQKKQYYENNKDKLNEKNKEYRENNKDKIKEYYENNKDKNKNKEYYENNKDKNKEYRENNKDKIKEKNKEYRENNKDKIKEYRENNKDKIKEYYENNKDKLNEKNKEYYENNKDKIKEQKKEYYENNKEKIICECGSIYSRSYLSYHKKSLKHINYISINK
jgi:hypothetical protein